MERLMSISKYIKQVRNRPEYKVDHLERISDLIQEDVMNLPIDIFRGLSYSKSSKLSSSKRDVIIVRSPDRETDRDEILRNLRQAGVDAKLGDSQSSVDPIDGKFEDRAFRIFVKPESGGMGETTLNASITELFPCIAFENKYKPKDAKSFHEYLIDVDLKKLKCVIPGDVEKAQEIINRADTSSKFEDKMNNAIAINKFILDQNKDKKIVETRWGPTNKSKPAGVPGGHPGDIFLTYFDKSILGVSLKAGGKKTTEPKLNTYVNTVFNAFRQGNKLRRIYTKVHKDAHGKIPGMPPANRFQKDRKTSQVLRDFDKKNNKRYEELYNVYLEIMRQEIIKLFNADRKNTLEYIKKEVLRDAPDVPTLVIKAAGKGYSEITEKDALGVFIPQVDFVKAYPSRTSKQNWEIELKSGSDSLVMKMSIRTNKSGHAGVKKLGQHSLAVKYNSLATK
tara:strand:- start:605 stop:1957 length:1353 start_codon:yes stop_codon:yes gene_type:complete